MKTIEINLNDKAFDLLLLQCQFYNSTAEELIEYLIVQNYNVKVLQKFEK